jgi:hypothetical protein
MQRSPKKISRFATLSNKEISEGDDDDPRGIFPALVSVSLHLTTLLTVIKVQSWATLSLSSPLSILPEVDFLAVCLALLAPQAFLIQRTAF